MAICNGSIKLYKKLLRKFIDGQTNFESTFRDEWLALHWKDATRIAHTLKGNAGNLGAEQLQAKAGKLEHSCTNQTDADTIESELKEVCLSLQQTFDDIRPMFDTDVNEDSPSATLGSANIIKDQFDNLEQRLNDFDMDAQQIIHQFQQYTFSSDIQIVLADITTHIEGYDFEAAKEDLERLRLILPLDQENNEDQVNNLQPQLLQVAQLIKDFDTAATDLLYELIEEIKDPIVVAQLNSIINVLDNYDFSGASVQLEKLL